MQQAKTLRFDMHACIQHIRLTVHACTMIYAPVWSHTRKFESQDKTIARALVAPTRLSAPPPKETDENSAHGVSNTYAFQWDARAGPEVLGIISCDGRDDFSLLKAISMLRMGRVVCARKFLRATRRDGLESNPPRPLAERRADAVDNCQLSPACQLYTQNCNISE